MCSCFDRISSTQFRIESGSVRSKQVLRVTGIVHDNGNAITTRLLLQLLTRCLCMLQTSASYTSSEKRMTTNDHLRLGFEQNSSSRISEPAISTLLVQTECQSYCDENTAILQAFLRQLRNQRLFRVSTWKWK